jgi:hypothetical protein
MRGHITETNAGGRVLQDTRKLRKLSIGDVNISIGDVTCCAQAFRQQGCLLELNAAIMSSVVIRREKKDVAIDLPDKIR